MVQVLRQDEAFLAAVHAVAQRAHDKLPLSNGRIDRAVEIVLAGGVDLGTDGHAVVASQSRPHTGYSVNGSCGCEDAGLSLAQAVAIFLFGAYTECGDASPDNVTRKVAPHFRGVALTRAKARALRDALGVDMVSLEELAEG